VLWAAGVEPLSGSSSPVASLRGSEGRAVKNGRKKREASVSETRQVLAVVPAGAAGGGAHGVGALAHGIGGL